jgi:hypothetical protein
MWFDTCGEPLARAAIAALPCHAPDADTVLPLPAAVALTLSVMAATESGARA